MNKNEFDDRMYDFFLQVEDEMSSNAEVSEELTNDLKEIMINYYEDEPANPVVPLPSMIDKIPNDGIDNYLSIHCGAAMAEKLQISRAKGRSGWHTSQCSGSFLLEMLKEHVEKGDMIDVINLAGMIFMREKLKSMEEDILYKKKKTFNPLTTKE